MATNFGFEPVKTGERYFISYKTEDTERVGRIARCLNQRGVPMWYDYGIEKGKRWKSEINKNIRECKDVILFATRNVFGHKDTFLTKEYELAEYHSKNIYVVWLDEPRKNDIHEDLVPWYLDVIGLQGLITIGEEPDAIAWRMINEIPLINGKESQPSTPIYRKATDKQRDNISELSITPLVKVEVTENQKDNAEGNYEFGGRTIRTDGERRTIRTVRVGDKIPFGRYPQGPNGEVEELIWRVLDVNEKQHRALLITEKLIDGVPYHERRENVTWEECTLRGWMNGKFMDDAFNDQEKSEIAMVWIDNSNNPSHGAKGRKPPKDRVFALSIEEAHVYFKDDSDRMAAVSQYLDNKGIYTNSKCNKEYNAQLTACRLENGEETGWWWLRSPGINSHNAAIVFTDGDVNDIGCLVYSSGASVRPALWLKL